MLEIKRDDFDESLDDIMDSINGILNKKGLELEKKDEEDDK